MQGIRFRFTPGARCALLLWACVTGVASLPTVALPAAEVCSLSCRVLQDTLPTKWLGPGPPDSLRSKQRDGERSWPCRNRSSVTPFTSPRPQHPGPFSFSSQQMAFILPVLHEDIQGSALTGWGVRCGEEDAGILGVRCCAQLERLGVGVGLGEGQGRTAGTPMGQDQARAPPPIPGRDP